MNTPDVRELFSRQGVDPEPNSPAEFAKMISDDYARRTKVIRATGLKFD
jgi:tripartite-type tricarboxylate transporter receptor subunit TctC